jgi:hypothetical protein
MILSGGGVIFFTANYPVSHEISSLPDFISGRWVGQFSENYQEKTSVVRYQLEFIKPDIVIYSRESAKSSLYNTVFNYEFVGEKQIRLKSRMIDEWEIRIIGADLEIHSSESLVKNGLYQRKPTISWEWSAVLFGMAIAGLFLEDLSILTRRKDTKNHSSELAPSIINSRWNFFLCGVVMIVGLISGYFLTSAFWYMQFLTAIRIPWDAVITIEIGVSILILGFKGIKLIFIKSGGHTTAYKLFGIYVCTFFLGYGFNGFLLGAAKLTVFIISGNYPYG